MKFFRDVASSKTLEDDHNSVNRVSVIRDNVSNDVSGLHYLKDRAYPKPVRKNSFKW